MVKLKKEEVIDRWSVLIDEAQGREKEVFREMQENLKEREVPKVEIVKKEVSPSLIRKLTGQARTFLVVKNTYLKGYLMYIGASSYGKQLFVSWYLTLEPGALQKLFAELPWFIQIVLLPIMILVSIYNRFKGRIVRPSDMDIFDLEELTAYVTTVHHTLLGTTEQIAKSVDFDFTKVDRKSRGFLNIS